MYRYNKLNYHDLKKSDDHKGVKLEVINRHWLFVDATLT